MARYVDWLLCRACQKKDWSSHKLACERCGDPVGCPFVVSMPQSKATYGYLCQLLHDYTRYVFIHMCVCVCVVVGSLSFFCKDDKQQLLLKVYALPIACRLMHLSLGPYLLKATFVYLLSAFSCTVWPSLY